MDNDILDAIIEKSAEIRKLMTNIAILENEIQELTFSLRYPINNETDLDREMEKAHE